MPLFFYSIYIYMHTCYLLSLPVLVVRTNFLISNPVTSLSVSALTSSWPLGKISWKPYELLSNMYICNYICLYIYIYVNTYVCM